MSARRARFNKVLFIDARGLWAHGARTNRELSAEDIGRIADACHAWRGEDADFKPYEDTPASPRLLV